MNTATYAERVHRWLMTLSVAFMSMQCCAAFSQEQQPNKPQPGTDRRKISQVAPAQEQSLKQLADQIETIEADLRKLRERIGTNDPNVVQAQKELTQLVNVQKMVTQLTDGELGENKKRAISMITGAIAREMARAQLYSLASTPEQAPEFQQLQQVKEQLAEREKQMGMLAKQMMEQQHQQPLPPLENGQLKVYSLAAVPAPAAAQTIESLFGSQVLRIAVDERSNSLIVYGKPDSLTAVDALLTRLDEQAAATSGGEKTRQSAATAPRSLLLRVFWLADNLPKGVGQTPTDFLPDSVIVAAKKLGLEGPRLVTQTVNSIALGREDAVDFSANVPAVLFDQPVGLNCQGRIKLVSDDRVRLEMGVHVGGPAINCELNGSLATPLGHYMVLGTANSVMAEGGFGMGAMGGAAGMMGPGGPGGGGGLGPGNPGQPFRGGAVRPGGGLGPAQFAGPEGAAGPGAAPGAEPGGPGAGQQPGKPNFNTSRFAFVVQVIDGQSYPAEKEKSGSK